MHLTCGKMSGIKVESHRTRNWTAERERERERVRLWVAALYTLLFAELDGGKEGERN